MTIELAWIWALAALPLPLLIARLWPRSQQPAPASLELPFADVMTLTGSATQQTPNRIRLLLAILCWILLVLAAARPQQIGKAVQLPLSGRDLMMAVDISGSMETPDMTISGQVVSRLTAVKAVAGEFIERRNGDRLGLILFGDQAYLQTPLTFDRQTVRTQLHEAAIGLAGKRTAIGDAIGLAVKRLRQQTEDNRILILLTDGDNTAGEVSPERAAELARNEKVRIYTIGIGAEHRLVQGFFGTQRVANTELDERSLKAIAKETGGQYFRARDIKELQKIYTLIDKIEPVNKDQKTFRPVDELYYWPLAISLLISLLMALQRLTEARFSSFKETRHA